MDFNTIKDKALPHVIAIIVFLLLTIIFYSPLIFEGKILNQNDINQGVAAGYEVKSFRAETGDEALWTNSMFGGMPSYLISVYWSGSEVLRIMERVISFGLPSSARETFISLLSFYVLLLVFGVRSKLAIAGAIAFGFSSFFIVSVEAGHLWKVRAIAYAPFIIAGVHLLFTKRYWWGLTLTALAVALEINSNHLQISYYYFLLLIIYGLIQLVYAIKIKEFAPLLKASGLLVIALVIAIGANLGKIWSTYEYGKYSIRGKAELSSNTQSSGGLDRDYAFAWSSGKFESLTLIIPNLYGGASGQYLGDDSALEEAMRRNNVPPQQINQYERSLLGYWGAQPFTSGPVYVSAIMVLLFIIALFYVEPKYKWWLISATILSLFLSWGKNFEAFNYFLFDYLQGYNKLRAVSMSIVIALTAIPLMGMIGLQKLLDEQWNEKTRKTLLIAGGITLGIIVLIALFISVPGVDSDQAPTWLVQAVKESRKDIVQSDAFRSFFFVLMALGAIFLLKAKKINYTVFSILLILFITLDLVWLDRRYVNSENFVSERKSDFFEKTPADELILQDEAESFRVLNLQNPFNEARTSVFHQSIGGYHGAKMRRYQDLINGYLEKEIRQIIDDRGLNEGNTEIISMLNAKYVLAGLTKERVIQNPYTNGNAWFVSKIHEAKNPDEEFEMLGKIDLDDEAVMDIEKFNYSPFDYDSSATITLTSYEPNELKYRSTSEADGYAVFSEIYYPNGWQAKIDGKVAEIDRVNYVLRGLNIPKGDHEIVFEFKPKVYAVGNGVMWGGNIIILVLLLLGLFKEVRRSKK
jgi:hypothetical protein